MELLASLENSAVATWVRESSSLLAYPTILFLHTIGMACLVGPNAAISLRLLGVAPRMPIAPLERLFRVMWVGFWINALSGTALLIADATTKLANPVFYIKMGCITFAVIIMVLIRRRVFRNPTLSVGSAIPTGRHLAVASLILWAAAITAGRLMAYIGPVSGAPGLINGPS